MESEAISLDISYCYIKIHQSVLHIWQGYLPMRGVVTLFISHLENSKSLSYAHIPCINTFII